MPSEDVYTDEEGHMPTYIHEGRPRRPSVVRRTLIPGGILAVETVVAVVLTYLAVAAMLALTGAVEPVLRFLLLLGAFALGGGLAAAIGNVTLPEPIQKWAEPWTSGGG